MKKRLKTTDTQNENSDDENGVNENEDAKNKKGELFKHVKESKEGDTETLDAATTVGNFYTNIKLWCSFFFSFLGTVRRTAFA